LANTSATTAPPIELPRLRVHDEVERLEWDLPDERRRTGGKDEGVARHHAPEDLEQEVAGDRKLVDRAICHLDLPAVDLAQPERLDDVRREREHRRTGINERVDLELADLLGPDDAALGVLPVRAVRESDLGHDLSHASTSVGCLPEFPEE
jgi:hypothetical protein